MCNYFIYSGNVVQTNENSYYVRQYANGDGNYSHCYNGNNVQHYKEKHSTCTCCITLGSWMITRQWKHKVPLLFLLLYVRMYSHPIKLRSPIQLNQYFTLFYLFVFFFPSFFQMCSLIISPQRHALYFDVTTSFPLDNNNNSWSCTEEAHCCWNFY